MKKFEIKDVGIKGKGVFALTNIKKGEKIILEGEGTSKLKKYTLEEIKNNPELMEHSDHCDYVGDGKYVVDLSMPSYVNHSCDPNTYIEFKNLKQKNSDMYAIKDIKKGDEITYDCSLNAIDQIKVEGTRSDVCYWNMECHCGSKNCRKVITGDFFELPKNIQLQKLPYLPTMIKNKYSKYLPKNEI